MMKRVITLASAGAAALTLSACYPPHPRRDEPLKVIARLDCPGSQGALTRTNAAADGRSCSYTDGDGAQVNLQLIAVTGGDPRAVLAPIEAQLRTEVGPSGQPTPPTPPTTTGAPTNGSDKDRVDIDLPGIHIHANGHDGSQGGVQINADDHGSRVRIDGHGATGSEAAATSDKGVSIEAGDNGAQIRVNERGSGLRSRFILASDTAGPHGYKVAGYQARGPMSGPLVVATLLAKSDEHDDLDHDIHQLLRLNVGG